MDSDFLRGRLALVTGGGRGIGAAVATRLAAVGARVVVCGRTRADLDALAASIDGVAITCDLADRADTDRMLAEVAALGRVDVLVNNAGAAESAPLAGTDDAMWDRLLELNASDLMYAAYGIEGDRVVLSAALPLDNLDANELDATLSDIDVALVRHTKELSHFARD